MANILPIMTAVQGIACYTGSAYNVVQSLVRSPIGDLLESGSTAVDGAPISAQLEYVSLLGETSLPYYSIMLNTQIVGTDDYYFEGQRLFRSARFGVDYVNPRFTAPFYPEIDTDYSGFSQHTQDATTLIPYVEHDDIVSRAHWDDGSSPDFTSSLWSTQYWEKASGTLYSDVIGYCISTGNATGSVVSSSSETHADCSVQFFWSNYDPLNSGSYVDEQLATVTYYADVLDEYTSADCATVLGNLYTNIKAQDIDSVFSGSNAQSLGDSCYVFPSLPYNGTRWTANDGFGPQTIPGPWDGNPLHLMDFNLFDSMLTGSNGIGFRWDGGFYPGTGSNDVNHIQRWNHAIINSTAMTGVDFGNNKSVCSRGKVKSLMVQMKYTIFERATGGTKTIYSEVESGIMNFGDCKELPQPSRLDFPIMSHGVCVTNLTVVFLANASLSEYASWYKTNVLDAPYLIVSGI